MGEKIASSFAWGEKKVCFWLGVKKSLHRGKNPSPSPHLIWSAPEYLAGNIVLLYSGILWSLLSGPIMGSLKADIHKTSHNCNVACHALVQILSFLVHMRPASQAPYSCISNATYRFHPLPEHLQHSPLRESSEESALSSATESIEHGSPCKSTISSAPEDHQRNPPTTRYHARKKTPSPN